MNVGRSALAFAAAVSLLVVSAAHGSAHGSAAQDGESRVEEFGESRVEEFGEGRVDAFDESRELVLTARTVLRQEDAPAIDTSSDDDEVISLRTDDVLFEFGEATLAPGAEDILDQAVRQIEELDPVELIITGYTDHIGSESFNQQLSEERADVVDTAIADRLADAPPTEVSGRGQSDPVAPNELPDGSDNPDGRALNRRVEIEVIT